ncbi:hypothetical protein, partial [Amycolatopsis sp. NPDC000740]|uniref:hypothetical protein n=1 Tax=Amycolatopsis sp. NPDC000740 TaxID=3154269 RepID=UPI00331E91E7
MPAANSLPANAASPLFIRAPGAARAFDFPRMLALYCRHDFSRGARFYRTTASVVSRTLPTGYRIAQLPGGLQTARAA